MACEVYDRYCEQGISRRVYRDTFYDLTLWCENCYKAYGEYGIAQYDWFCRHLDMSLFRLGRLEFERIPSLWEIQTDGISVHKGDPVISVHIPQGEKLELDACLDSFRQAEQFWKEKQVYLCHSWLLYPGLKEIMKPESNILQLQTLFHIVAVDFEGREAEERISENWRRIPKLCRGHQPAESSQKISAIRGEAWERTWGMDRRGKRRKYSRSYSHMDTGTHRRTG